MVNIRPDEIGRIIREQIDKYDQEIKADNIGKIFLTQQSLKKITRAAESFIGIT